MVKLKGRKEMDAALRRELSNFGDVVRETLISNLLPKAGTRDTQTGIIITLEFARNSITTKMPFFPLIIWEFINPTINGLLIPSIIDAIVADSNQATKLKKRWAKYHS